MEIDEEISRRTDSGGVKVFSAPFWETVQISNLSALIIILFAVSLIILPIPFMGVPDGFDLMQHFRFATAFHDAIVNAEFIPAWAAADNFGYGSIGVRYYPPLTYFVLAITKIVTGSWYHSFWITSFGWMFLGGVGVYLWVREVSTRFHAITASLIYIIAPYHTFQIYQALLIAEFAAAAILPFCFLFLTRICSDRRHTDVILFAISYSLLILTHIPSTIIASLAMAVYGFLLMEKKSSIRSILAIGSGILLSLIATSFHWIKIATEIDWVKHNTTQFFAIGYYDYKNFFFPLIISSNPTRYINKLLWHVDIFIVLTIVLFVPAIGIFIWNRARKKPHASEWKTHRAVIIAGLYSLFMLSIASTAIWNVVPVLQKLQFPWRWILVTTLFASVSFALAVPSLIFAGKIKRLFLYPVILLVMLILLFDITQNMIPSTPLEQKVFEQKITEIHNEKGCDCWWPIWAKSDAFNIRERALAGSRNVSISDWKNTTREFTIESGDAAQMRVATFYHPYWQATVNDKLVSVENDENGAIQIPLPPETAKVVLSFKEPGYYFIAKILSLIMWLLFAAFAAFYYFKPLRAKLSPA